MRLIRLPPGPLPRAVVIAIPALLLGCEPEAEVDCSHEPALTWENHGALFTRTYCTGCHSSLINEAQRNGAPDNVNFDSYVGVLSWIDTIQVRVDEVEDEDEPTMPPGGGPTPQEYAAFREWLQCGATDDAAVYFGEDE